MTTRNRRILVATSWLFTLLGLTLIYLSFFGPDEFVWRHEIQTGNQILRRVESFRQEHHRLPDSLEEVGVNDSDSLGINYQKCDANLYLIWFGTSLGESMSYDPVTRKWKHDNNPCPRTDPK